MNELTVKEIAGILGIGVETAKARIRLLGIKEARKVGRTNIYHPSVVDKIRDSNSVGRPRKKKPELETGSGNGRK